jgi:hypothetical protein
MLGKHSTAELCLQPFVFVFQIQFHAFALAGLKLSSFISANQVAGITPSATMSSLRIF